MKQIYLFFCTLSSLSIAIWVYAIKSGWSLSRILKKGGLEWSTPCSYWVEISFSATLYFLIILFLAYITTLFFKKLDPDQIESENIKLIRPAGNELVLTYFGLFFYALSAPNGLTFIITFIILTFALFFTTRGLYNPLFLFLGYRFYNVDTGKRSILIISKYKYKEGDTIFFPNLKVINDFTYVDLEE